MSDTDSSFANFGKLVPGFDFLQNLTRQAAGSASQGLPQMPQLASWVAPTVSVEELDKRIQELKAVQFWLDQNATALKATIQALEVQKMTLATLKSMNMAMGDVASAFTFKPQPGAPDGAKSGAHPAPSFAGLEVPASSFGSGSAGAASGASSGASPGAESGRSGSGASPAAAAPASLPAASPGVVDPLQWWGALTQQFQTIAADAMKDVAKKAAIQSSRKPGAGPLEGAIKSATDAATELTKNMQAGMTQAISGQVDAGAAPRGQGSTALRTGSAWPTPAAGKKSSTAKAARASATAKTPAKTLSKKSGATKSGSAGRK